MDGPGQYALGHLCDDKVLPAIRLSMTPKAGSRPPAAPTARGWIAHSAFRTPHSALLIPHSPPGPPWPLLHW